MDPLIIDRLERLSERFTGFRIKINVLPEPPIFLIRRRIVERLDEGMIEIRFGRNEKLSDRIFWTAQTLFLEAAFRINLQHMEQYDDPRLYKSDAILAGAFLAEFAAVIGTDWEDVMQDQLIQRESESKAERRAGALFLRAGAFGLVPFDQALSELDGNDVSILDVRVKSKLAAVIENLEVTGF
ncbi:MAG: hypothetical protein ACKVQS_09780 [Fimbriimonadaceae bacterium]